MSNRSKKKANPLKRKRSAGQDWRRKKKRVMERDKGICQICQLPEIDPENPMTVDHIKPLSKGGSNAIINLQLAHYDCNQEKGDGPHEPVISY